MKRRGFTIIEILATIIILGIIISIALPIYLYINEIGRKKASENKIKQIEITAEKWADENNITSPITIPILQLVKSGYMNADEGETDSVIDPYTKEDIKCKQIDIYFEDNLIIAKYNDETVEDCEIKMNEEYDENIDLQAYKYVDKQEDELVINDIREIFWTNTDVLLTVDLIKDADYELKENGEIRYSGGGLNEVKTISEETPICTNIIVDVDKCSNAVVVSGENIITTIYITVETNKGLKTTKVTVKIDKVAPDLRIEVDNSEFINKDRKIDIRVNDGLTGSGVREVYHNYSNSKEKSEDTIKIDIPYDGRTVLKRDNDKYYFYAVDIAGNTSEVQEIEVIRVDKSAPEIESFTDNSEWINKDREVIITASDDEIPEHENGPNESGIIGIYYNTEESYEDAILVKNYEQIRKEFNDSNNKDNGTYYFFAIDYVGNKSDFEKVYVEKVDKTPPEIIKEFTKNKVTTNVYPINTTMTVTCKDDESGLESSTSYNLIDLVEDENKLQGKQTFNKITVYNSNISCKNNAGSSNTENISIESAQYTRLPLCGVERYNSCVLPVCGVAAYHSCTHSDCGTTTHSHPQYYYVQEKITSTCWGGIGYGTCSHSTEEAYYKEECCQYQTVQKFSHYIYTYTTNTCATPACGIASYKSCENPACGIALYNLCWNNGSKKY